MAGRLPGDPGFPCHNLRRSVASPFPRWPGLLSRLLRDDAIEDTGDNRVVEIAVDRPVLDQKP